MCRDYHELAISPVTKTATVTAWLGGQDGVADHPDPSRTSTSGLAVGRACARTAWRQ